MNLQDILENRSVISNKVKDELKEELYSWGFNINKFEISELNPKNRLVKEALKNQINAEQQSKETRITADSFYIQTQNQTDGEF